MLLALATKKPLGKGLGAYFMKTMNMKQLLAGSVLYLALPLPPCILQSKKHLLGFGAFNWSLHHKAQPG